MTSYDFKFVVLAILDGWGIAPEGPGNAIALANTVNMDKFLASYPNTQLEASGEAVGLPRGEDGNTETGHLNLGAGRIVYQDLERINMSIAEGDFFENETLLNAVNHVKENNSNLHIMGLVGAGGVHSNIDHLFALIQLASNNGIKDNLYLHLFTDGRDSPPTAAKTYIKHIKETIQKEDVGKIASIMGRYWAMDRDQRWDRTKKAYDALTKGAGKLVKSAEEAIDASYSDGKTDEFIEPSLITKQDGNPLALIKENDSVIFFNFRIDRPRQLTKAFILDDFSKADIAFDFDPYKIKYEKTHIGSKEKDSTKAPFERGRKINNLFFVTMTQYSGLITEEGGHPAFPPKKIDMPLGRVISTAGMRQLRITESEKERFVTHYFNGLNEEAFNKEERIILPSPKVSTYDQKPEMASSEITNKLLEKLKTGDYQFALVNFPNVDMVGHTGNIGPAIKAVETVDECIGKIANFVNAYQGILTITADHGNAEEMINTQTGEIDTEHSTNKVPFVGVSQQFLGKRKSLPTGILADVAPTMLSLLKIEIPSNMTGRNLLAEVLKD